MDSRKRTSPAISRLNRDSASSDWSDSLPRLHAAILADLSKVLAMLRVYRAGRPFVDPALALMEADLEHAHGVTRAAQELTDELWRVVCRLNDEAVQG